MFFSTAARAESDCGLSKFTKLCAGGLPRPRRRSSIRATGPDAVPNRREAWPDLLAPPRVVHLAATEDTMASFVLIPGAGGMAWYWHPVVPLLRAAGHEAIAIDLPGDDSNAGLSAYADIVISAIVQPSDTILVAQSLGGFTAPLVCTRTQVAALAFVNAMIPKPGETAGAWWDATGAVEAREREAARRGYSTEFDLATYFLHDVPQDVLRDGPQQPREEAATAFGEPCRFERWPEIPIHVVAGRDDRFFPLEFQRRVARERLGKDVEEVPGGHLVALSNPQGLAERLLAFEKALAN
jgi:pimeloyl-ACP methyl ester carboxylesterase